MLQSVLHELGGLSLDSSWFPSKLAMRYFHDYRQAVLPCIIIIPIIVPCLAGTQAGGFCRAHLVDIHMQL